MKKVIFLSIAAMFFMTSCGTVGIVSSPTTYQKSGKAEVTAKKSGTNILGLTPMDAHKVSKELLDELSKKCSQGVTNIRTTVSASSFPIIMMEKIEISGDCK